MTKRALTIGLIFVIPFAAGSIMAGSAMGALYTYRVNGKLLETGQTKEVTLTAKTNQVLTGEAKLIGKFSVTCSKLTLDSAEKPIITGGVPGTSARDKLVYSGCISSSCEKTTVEGSPLQGEIVTVVLPSAKEGHLAIELSPSSGATFATVTTHCLGIPVTGKFEGTVAFLDSSQGTEQPVVALTAEAGSGEITEVQKSTGAKEKVGLRCEERPASFTGESELALVSKESWGIF